MTRVAHKAREQAFVEIPEMGTVQEIGGLESRNVQEKLELLTRALNDQANQLDEWREKVIELLICPLVDEEGTTDIRGDEYDESTKTQDERTYTLRISCSFSINKSSLRLYGSPTGCCCRSP